MVQASGVRVPRSQAEATRRRLVELDVLRIDLGVAREGDDVIFPVLDSCGPRMPTAPFEFEARTIRPASYLELLPPEVQDVAPRAFEAVGDIVVVKVPPAQASHRALIGAALQRFHGARAVFHDKGVKDEFRVRDLELIAGEGGPLTLVSENGVKLWIDLSKAYFSPRLAAERARVAAQVRPGEHVVDLFGGVAPFGVQAALRGAVVDSIDLNPEAVALARRNVEANKVEASVRLHEGDARQVAKTLEPADRVLMNLPHGARHFLDVACKLVKPGGIVHYHEISSVEGLDKREKELKREMAWNGRPVHAVSVRVVRNYSPQEAHFAFDLKV
ncbi:MAG TPA: class I SAM-dependent methyltransferase family protein [Candidatus Thermoplasmatota archaeon]|nr:class I SAM-dependent methyltransferase family protein [Candidatus Thermoplasmatota archaeon]